MAKFLLVIIFVSTGFFCNAQQGNIRMQSSIEHRLETGELLHLFVKGDLKSIEKITLELGGIYKYGYKNLSAVEIPPNKIENFLNSHAVKQIESGEVSGGALLDSSLSNAHVFPVHAGETPLATTYKGSGVVMGIIDDGIDFTHPDFIKPNGDSRIRYIWDQTVSGAVLPYGYGKEWTQFDIDNGIVTHVEQGTPNRTHGSNVSGIAAGNGRAVGEFTGVAPESDIITVSILNNNSFLSNLVDGVDYIFKKADAMGKPCVINISFGTYFGSHDGKDLYSQMIDALLEERPGRAVVAAAGNAGGVLFHLGYEIDTTPSFTWFKTVSNSGSFFFKDVFFELWADTADFNDVLFAFQVDKPPGSYDSILRTQFINIPIDYGVGSIGIISDTFNLTMINSSGFVATIKTFVELVGQSYLLQVWIDPVDTDNYWRFITKGAGSFDIWSSESPVTFMLTSDMVATLPSSAVVPDIDSYKLPDTRKSMVSSFQNSDKVIAVANYLNREVYTDIDGNVQNPTGNKPEGEIEGSSSQGPTRDGRTKPDISAPGGTTLTTGNTAFTTAALGPNRNKLAPGGRHNRNGGTSMASPVVAGVAALYLEKNPNAWYREVKDAILLSALRDTFTTPDSNSTYGYGKVCAFAALQMNLIYGCTDDTALNYDPNANMDDGSCIAIKFGCTDEDALNYDSTATTDDGSCDLGVGIANLFGSGNIVIQFQPNVFSTNSRIIYSISPKFIGKSKLSIVNTLGQEVDLVELPNNEGVIQYTFPTTQAGVYLYHVLSEGQSIEQGRIIIY